MILYSIRAKESTDTVDVDAPIDSPSSPTTPVNAINAAYHPLAHFIPSGTQGQEPWCSEHISASAINTLNQITASTPQDSRVTVQGVMQAFYPNVGLDQLKTMSGVKIDDYLKVLQSKYQVTVDVENRTLNFDEVKKELDGGQIIQMDAYDQNETAPQGSEDNEGHALAIVGYILPADGDTTKHAPYYEVWNPWWGYTFYVSSKAPYFNLAGTQYKWTRTWHNWRKVTAGATTKTAPVIAQQKVASAPNPEAIKVKTLPQLSPKVPLYNPKTPNPTNYLFQVSPLPQNNILNELSSEMKPSITVYAPFYKDHFGYSQSKDNLVLKAWWNNKSPKFAPATRDTPISNFADDVDDLIGLGNEINAALAGDWATIVLVLVIAATNPEIMGAVTILQTLGVLSGVNLMFVVKTAYSYISTVNDTKKQFNSI